ncbi:MAG TPA: hypothetical protein VLA88_00180 [Candidatus Saccharimonadales bacterium]|nr:hypothetical protein [Candidatus Saccharimonadales bacterium]
MPQLSEKQAKILEGIEKGLNSQQITAAYGIPRAGTYIPTIYTLFGLQGRSELMFRWLRQHADPVSAEAIEAADTLGRMEPRDQVLLRMLVEICKNYQVEDPGDLRNLLGKRRDELEREHRAMRTSPTEELRVLRSILSTVDGLYASLTRAARVVGLEGAGPSHWLQLVRIAYLGGLHAAPAKANRHV